jgi:hypothetical protein
MPVTVRASFDVGEAFAVSDESVMRDVGLLARELILRRTARGVSADGSPFAPYSPGYIKSKSRAVGLAAPVNLRASGAMLNALQIVEVTKDRVVLGFA